MEKQILPEAGNKGETEKSAQISSFYLFCMLIEKIITEMLPCTQEYNLFFAYLL